MTSSLMFPPAKAAAVKIDGREYVATGVPPFVPVAVDSRDVDELEANGWRTKVQVNDLGVSVPTLGADGQIPAAVLGHAGAAGGSGGPTANRPASPFQFQQYYDTTLGYLVTYVGSVWVAA